MASLQRLMRSGAVNDSSNAGPISSSGNGRHHIKPEVGLNKIFGYYIEIPTESSLAPAYSVSNRA